MNKPNSFKRSLLVLLPLLVFLAGNRTRGCNESECPRGDADCEPGFVCAEGVCVIAPGEDQSAICAEICSSDEHCYRDGADIGLQCIDSLCRAPACTSDAACTFDANFGAAPCTTAADCAGSFVCVGRDGAGSAGGCASAPVDGTCFFGDVIEATDLDTGATIEVCGTRYECRDDGLCGYPSCATDDDCPSLRPFCLADNTCGVCTSDAHCTNGPFSVCIVERGECGCASDAECAENPGGPVCNPQGECGCELQEHCIGNVLGARCTERGSCGCQDTDDCRETPILDGTLLSCEAF